MEEKKLEVLDIYTGEIIDMNADQKKKPSVSFFHKFPFPFTIALLFFITAALFLLIKNGIFILHKV